MKRRDIKRRKAGDDLAEESDERKLYNNLKKKPRPQKNLFGNQTQDPKRLKPGKRSHLRTESS